MFTATIAPPVGVPTDASTKFIGRSGTTYMFNGSTQLVIGDEKDYLAFVNLGWTTVSVSRT